MSHNEMYAKKKEYAAQRSRRDKENICTLTAEQHDALAEMASARHLLHTNISKLIAGDRSVEKDVIRANHAIEESGLSPIGGIPTDETDFIDIDDIEILSEIGEYDVSRHDDIYVSLYHEWEQVNQRIEEYLRKIDKVHGTHYAPTGWSRI